MTNAINNMGQSNPIASNLPSTTTQGTGRPASSAAPPTAQTYEYGKDGKLAPVQTGASQPATPLPPGEAWVKQPGQAYEYGKDGKLVPVQPDASQPATPLPPGEAWVKQPDNTGNANGKPTPPAREEGKNDLMV
ncbi:hypothetical protein [Paraburkholderia sp.]|jgi:hypothetical protein|uniref:hypothetical protein n=1 Tax=Paraburkholderia sp. TaxID=1926495 RepID=UPI003C5942D9